MDVGWYILNVNLDIELCFFGYLSFLFYAVYLCLKKSEQWKCYKVVTLYMLYIGYDV